MPSPCVDVRVGYDFSGKECDPDGPKVVAKKLLSENGSRYWVKARAWGPYSGSLYNPLTPGNDVAAKRDGMDPFKFRELSVSAFELYMTFLETKNPMFASMAQREMISTP